MIFLNNFSDNNKRVCLASILLALIVGLYVGYTSFIVSLSLMSFLFIWMNNSERSIVLLLFGKHLLGIICQFYQIPIPGSIIALGLALLFSWKFAMNQFIWNPRWKYIIFILVVFSLYYYFGIHTEYATQKYSELFTTGICVFFVYSLLSHDFNVSPQRISFAFALYALFLFAFAFDFYGFPHPSSIADVGFYRDTCVLLAHNDESAVGQNYQEIGMTGLLSLAFWTSNKKNFKTTDIIILLLIAWVTLLSGSRQAIFGVIILAVVWSVVRMERLSVGHLTTMATVITVAYILMLTYQTDSLNQALLSDGTLDDRLGGRPWSDGWKTFLNNPWTGCGFGQFMYHNFEGQLFPHNIFIEILCEFGLLGLLLLGLPVILFLIKYKVMLKDKYANGAWFIMIFMAYFIRANISGDLGENISLFVILVSYTPFRCYKAPKVKDINSCEDTNSANK